MYYNYLILALLPISRKYKQWRIQEIWRGGRKTIHQLRPHLSQMRTAKYMPSYWKVAFWKKIMSQ